MKAAFLHRRSVLGFLTLAGALWLAACDEAAGDVKTWSPADHDHTSQPSSGQVDVTKSATNPLATHGVDEVALISWRKNCVPCHGIVGRGDGPQGPMLKPPDLTDPERQAALTDADVENLIKQGRGRMPSFSLPDSTVTGLVRLVRLLNRGNPAPPTSGAPGASAAPGAGAAPPDSAGSASPEKPPNSTEAGPPSARPGAAAPAPTPAAPH